MIELNGVCLKRGARRILDNVSAVIPPAAFVVVSGPSGAGKTSLLRLLASFEKISDGDIRIQGRSLQKMSRTARAEYRRTIGYTGHDVGLLPQLTCFENVALPLRIQGCRQKDIDSRVRAALTRVGLQQAEQARPDELSGGEQQRLQIARAVVNRPQILLADEPVAQLDAQSAQWVADLFLEFNQAGVTVIVTGHQLEPFRALTHELHLVHGTVKHWKSITNDHHAPQPLQKVYGRR